MLREFFARRPGFHSKMMGRQPKRISSQVPGLHRSRLWAERCRSAVHKSPDVKYFDPRPRGVRASSSPTAFERAYRLVRPLQWRLRKVDSQIFAWNPRRALISRKAAPLAWPSAASRPTQTAFEAQTHVICGEVSSTRARPRASYAASRVFREFARKLSHLDSSKPGLIALISAFQTSTIDSLLERVAGQHAENQRHSGIKLSELNPASGFGYYDIIV